MNKIYFAKLLEEAIIPSKRDEDCDYDVYACFDREQLKIKPREIVKVQTGIMSAFDKKYKMVLEERGSTGTLGMAVRAGEIDSGYRGEWIVPIQNTTNKTIYITKKVSKVLVFDEVILYPYNKAICQAGLVEVPQVEVVEKTREELWAMESARGKGMLGSSGK